MAQRWIADLAWLGGDDLAPDVLIEVSNRRFATIAGKTSADEADRINGIVVPGLVNTHSHAFHRLLRGRAHGHGGDFWIWRELMYETAGSLTPETYEELATAVYSEMAIAGVTSVGEFHYLHHQSRGKPYDDPNEMGHALIRAARRAGIRICLLDTGYLRGGFDDSPLHPVQERFSDSSVDAWLDRVEDLSAAYSDDDDVRVGIAPHSVRAIPQEALGQITDRSAQDTPIHIHVSEQPAENQACLEHTGLTPTGLLSSAGLLGPDTTAVHATHLTEIDVATLGDSKTGVCYCATTERDLADGIGPAAALRDAGSSISVGSDSHAVIDIFEEARGVEMHSRLTSGQRGIFAPSHLWDTATGNGSVALGFERGGLSEGAPADFVVISAQSPRTSGVTAKDGAAFIMFSATAADVLDVFVGGRKVVADSEHAEWRKTRHTLG